MHIEGLPPLRAIRRRTSSGQHAILRIASLFVAVVCLSLIAINLWRSWEGREAMLQQSEVFGGNLARSLAQHADDKIKEADTLLHSLAERMQVDGMGPASAARLHPLLMQIVRETPQLHGLFIYDEHGGWIVNSQPVLLKHFNNADRNYFIHHQNTPSDDVHIGPPILSRSTGEWIITVSRRIDHHDGRFAGVALATLDMRHFNDYYASFDVGQHGSILLTTSAGTLLAQHPFDPTVMGLRMAGQPELLTALARAQHGSATLPDAQDLRLYNHHPLKRYPLVAVVSRTHAEILADWRSDAVLHLLVLLSLAGGLGLAGAYLVQQIGKRVATENALRGARDALESANRSLEKLASEDALTGIANRRRFDITLHSECGRAVRHARPLALILLDVDHFKQYNDSYGHLAGDECLRHIAQAVLQAGRQRAGDLVARYGGEELVVLLPETEAEGARTVAERIRSAVRALEIPHSGSPTGFVSLSAGIHACAPTAAGPSPDELVRCADLALYRAKASGRNRIVLYEATMG